MTPRLALNYHSKARDGWLGAGWNLSMTYIEADVMRRTPSASDALTDTAGRFRDARFVYVNNQVRRALVSIGPNQYRMQMEDRYLAFSFNGSDWEAYDGLGTHYFFGVCQVDNLGMAVRWYLGMVVDTNQNWTGFLYRDSTSGPQDIITKTPNAVFLRAVVWNGINPPSYAPADWQRSWSALFKNRIEFVSEPRSDKVYVSEFGVLSTITERLKEIQVFSEDQRRSVSWTSTAIHFPILYIPMARPCTSITYSGDSREWRYGTMERLLASRDHAKSRTRRKKHQSAGPVSQNR